MKKILIFIIILIAILSFVKIQNTNEEKNSVENYISNFKECVDSGNPVMESYPRQCNAGDETFTEDIGNEIEKSNFIMLSNPRPNQNVKSPLIIEGHAKGSWFFEGSFPVVLTNWDGLIIGQGIAKAQGEWMTEEFVPFTATIEFEVPSYKNNGALILKKDNPSGLPENDDSLEIPVFFSGEEEAKDDILLPLESFEDALKIAEANEECSKVGTPTDQYVYNENSKTWWIGLEQKEETKKEGCNPACVVYKEKRTAEVNWRCTGLIMPENKEKNIE